MRLFIKRRIVRFKKGGIQVSKEELKVGDIVKIKHHTESEKDNYPIFWAQTMEQFEGQISTIEDIWDEVKDPRSGQKTKAY